MRKEVVSRTLQSAFLIVFVFIWQRISSDIGWDFASLFDYSSIDKDGTFMMVSVHHILMSLLTLGLLYILHKWKKIDFKINFKADAYGARFTCIYCAACFIYSIFWYGIFGFVLNSITHYGYELSAINILGTLGFQLFLSGTEELMFRALPIGCFKTVWEKNSKFADAAILLLTSLLFVIVHIHFGKPLLSQLYNLILVFIHGLVYGISYLKSKSIVYPMVMHGISNFISVGGCYLYMMLSRVS